MSTDNPLLSLGRSVLQQQAFSRLLGAELSAWDAQQCTLELPLRPDLLQQNGFAHGGVVSYLADNALTYAGGAALGAGVVTSEFKINYVRPAVGERLIARASPAAVSKTQAVCRCDVFAVSAGQEKLCAVALGTIVRLATDGA
jgi:uncharacterized protein (TIGR00369 family)